ncbi:MAG: cellulase family glycosylhydrolase [Leptolyngbyaceae cyanobacterium]
MDRFPTMAQRSLRYGLCFCLSLLLVLAINFLPLLSASTPAEPSITARSPLSTQGSRIIDSQGQTVLLRGVNWFGMETETHTPHGLWSRDYKEMLQQIRSLGYNTIRLPFSVQSLRSQNISGVDFNNGSNQDLQGKTPLEVMDLVIQEAERQGLWILLDSHRLNDYRIPELWYGDGFTEADWIGTWELLAQRYRNQANVIGADLKNEPHGAAGWGTGDRATDWRLAAERAGNAIQAINSDWLIVVEGVQNNVPGQQLDHWWGGNLEGVKNYPVRLPRPNKLVYSPHEYGAGVHNQPWFNEPSFPQNLLTRWQIGFHYIAEENIAPILIGEFGGRQVDANSKEGIWQRKLVDFIRQNDLNFTYWSWNPNSGDTGGILQDDWRSIDEPKQALLNTTLTASEVAFAPTAIRTPAPEPTPESTPTPTPEPTPTPTPEPTPTPIPTPEPIPVPTPTPTPTPQSESIPVPTERSQLQAAVNLQSDWQQGFCLNFQVTNTGAAPTQNWQLRFQMNQAAIQNGWNGNFINQGTQYTVTPPDWGRAIQPGDTVEWMGFCAAKSGDDYLPTQVTAQPLN